jgi:hypothetical protein
MKIKKVEELAGITDQIVDVIKNHIETSGETTTGFAHKVGVHPLQLLGFLRRERGMHIDTIEKIGASIKNSRVK